MTQQYKNQGTLAILPLLIKKIYFDENGIVPETYQMKCKIIMGKEIINGKRSKIIDQGKMSCKFNFLYR